MSKMLGTPSSGVTLLEGLVYGDVNMTSVDFVNVSPRMGRCSG